MGRGEEFERFPHSYEFVASLYNHLSHGLSYLESLGTKIESKGKNNKKRIAKFTKHNETEKFLR